MVVTAGLGTLGFLYKYMYVLWEGKNIARLNLIFKSVVFKIPEAAYMVSLYQFPKSTLGPISPQC